MRSLSQSSAGPVGPNQYTAPTGFSQSPYTRPNYPFGCRQTSDFGAVQAPHTVPLTVAPHSVGQSFFDIRNETVTLSAHAKDHVTQALQNAWADSTFKHYTGAIKQYILFCDTEQVPQHLRFPADEFVLCAFAASSFRRHAGGTPRSRISALKAWHIAHNVEWKGSSRLRYVLSGVQNVTPRSSKRPPRPPISGTMLTQLIENLDLNLPLDTVVAACAATAFWGQCRLGELLPSSSSPSSSLPTRSHFKRSRRNPLSCTLHLPSTKTHRHGQSVILVDQRDPINPITLLKTHIRVNAVQKHDHIFSYNSACGRISLSKTRFLKRCNEIWSRLGYPRTTGHCFRIGGTTELLVAGTPPDVVRVMGRWSSDSFLRYWRSLDDIVPLHIRNLRISKYRYRRSSSRPPLVG
jgi:hypothetical protein